MALTSKRAVAMLADTPVVNYAVTQTHGQLQGLGNQYLAALYGIALPKGDGSFAKAVQGAVQALINDGTYAKIIAKWPGSDGATATSEINPNTGQ
ncbi:MAG TPA: transporter substrate-binding domain-containing protein [Pseudonocardia sp.]